MTGGIDFTSETSLTERKHLVIGPTIFFTPRRLFNDEDNQL